MWRSGLAFVWTLLVMGIDSLSKTIAFASIEEEYRGSLSLWHYEGGGV